MAIFIRSDKDYDRDFMYDVWPSNNIKDSL